jgi:hypothetical protein
MSDGLLNYFAMPWVSFSDLEGQLIPTRNRCTNQEPQSKLPYAWVLEVPGSVVSWLPPPDVTVLERRPSEAAETVWKTDVDEGKSCI